MNYQLFKATIKWILTSDSPYLYHYVAGSGQADYAFPGRIAWRLNNIARYFGKYQRRARAMERVRQAGKHSDKKALDLFTHEVVKYNGTFDEFRAALLNDAPRAVVDKELGVTYLAGSPTFHDFPKTEVIKVQRFGGPEGENRLTDQTEVTIRWPEKDRK